jgi:hypothetical protein
VDLGLAAQFSQQVAQIAWAPQLATMRGRYAKTPPGFIFAAKVPQVITHEEVLRNCQTGTKAIPEHDGPAG